MAAYATPSQLIDRYDVRTIGQLVSDNGIQVSRQDLEANTKVLAALADASGEIEASVLQAKRYTTADLAGLTGNSANHLTRITCVIAFGFLWERRPYADDDDENGRGKAEKRARLALESLRKGQTIFDVDEVKEAGLPAVNEPSIQRIQQQNLPVDQARGHYYPRRRLPY
jgi:phage gp36-like protein